MLRVSEWMKIYFQLQRAWATSQKQSQCLSEHLQERVRGMFARELGAARQLTEEVPQHPANARKINTAREVRLRVRLSATWTKNRATDFTRVPGVWFFARQRTSKIYFQWENNRQITPRTQKARMFGIVYGECPHIFATEPWLCLYMKNGVENFDSIFHCFI